MRTQTQIIICLLSILILFETGCSKPHKGPIAMYNQNPIDLGTIKLNNTYHGKFAIKNEGDDDLDLKEITSDCECTVIKEYNKLIKSGQSTFIHFDLKPHMTGFDQQNIFIKNNSKNASTVLITIRAEVDL